MPTSTPYTVGDEPVKIRTGTPRIAGLIVTPAADVRASGTDVTDTLGTLIEAGERADLPPADWHLQSVSGADVAVMVTEYEAGE